MLKFTRARTAYQMVSRTDTCLIGAASYQVLNNMP